MRPLAGVRVLDLTAHVSGPVCTGLLGSLGAEVIKIENTTPRGRTPQESMSRAQRIGSMSELQRNKLGITLNLSKPEARDIFSRMVRLSDVVIDNFSPRVMRHFGFEYHDLKQLKDDIIVVSMPAFGNTGPLRDMISLGPGIDAMSGLSHLTGYPDSPPLKPGNYYCDYNAGVLAALAVMSALFHRKKTGEGQAIEVAMRDGETQLLGEFVLDFILNQRVQERQGNRHPTKAPHSVYRCLGEDNWIAIAIGTDAEWASLSEIIGRPELALHSKFATVLARKQNEEEVDQLVSGWAANQEHRIGMEILQAAGIPAGAVLTTEEVSNDPQFIFRNTFPRVKLDENEYFRLARPGWIGHHTLPEIQRGPDYSEHTEQILHTYLGMTPEEITRLAEVGAVALPERSSQS